MNCDITNMLFFLRELFISKLFVTNLIMNVFFKMPECWKCTKGEKVEENTWDQGGHSVHNSSPLFTA